MGSRVTCRALTRPCDASWPSARRGTVGPVSDPVCVATGRSRVWAVGQGGARWPARRGIELAEKMVRCGMRIAWPRFAQFRFTVAGRDAEKYETGAGASWVWIVRHGELVESLVNARDEVLGLARMAVKEFAD